MPMAQDKCHLYQALPYVQKYTGLPLYLTVVVVVFVYFILSRLLYLAFSANLGLLCMLHPNMGPLV